jgi:hypothetical protein
MASGILPDGVLFVSVQAASTDEPSSSGKMPDTTSQRQVSSPG